MSATNRVAKNTGILYVRMAITVFISLYSTRLILNALGTVDYGIFNVVAGAIAMLTFLNNAMAGATQRYITYAEGEGNKHKVKTIFNVSVVLHFIIAACVLILLEVVGHFLFNGILKIPINRIDTAKLIFQFMIVSTLFTIISVPYDAVINANENMLMVAILGIIEAVFKLLIAIYLTYCPFDKLIIYGSATACSTIILLAVRWMYCRKKYPECAFNIIYFEKPIFNDIAGFAGWNLLGATTSMLSVYGQGPVLNSFFGSSVNAAQGIANQVNGQLSTFANTMLKALSPIIGKSEGAGDKILFKNATYFGSQLSFFLLILLYNPVIIEMPLIFSFWLNNVPPFAIIFCRLLLLQSLFAQLSTVLNIAIATNGNIKKYELTGSIILIIPITISIFLFRNSFPPEAMYVVFLGFYVILLAHRIYFANRNIGWRIKEYLFKVLCPCFLLFLITICISYSPLLFLEEGFLRLILVVIINSILLITCLTTYIYSNHKDIFTTIKNKIFNHLNKGYKL